jgi:hypothetical protein
MDMCSSPGIVEDIIYKLEEMGFNAPLVLYSSKIDYKQIPNLPSYVIHENKPYVPGPLPELLALGDINVKGQTETVSLHCSGVSQKVPKDSILYILANDGNSGSTITLSDHNTIVVDEELGDVRRILEHYDEFLMINKTTIANFKYVASVMFTSITMQNHTKFGISPLNYNEFKYHKREIDEL